MTDVSELCKMKTIFFKYSEREIIIFVNVKCTF